MLDIKLADGKRALIIDINDLFGYKFHHKGIVAIKNIFHAVRASHQIIMVLVSPNLGVGALPKWLRQYVKMGVLRPSNGDFGSSYYLMELAPDQTWIKEG